MGRNDLPRLWTTLPGRGYFFFFALGMGSWGSMA